jgi:glycosyltransferase involved in cell wall biosynthesis
MTIAALIMTKNEAKRIEVTIASVVGKVDGIILFDTGSEDDTVIVAERAANDTPIHVKHGQFIDFATSRNEALEFAAEFGYDLLVLLDANDEMVGARPVIEDDNINKSWYVEQKLKHGHDDVMSFWNVRLIRSSCGLRFKGSVHEYLDRCEPTERIHDFYLFQDKTMDGDDKTEKRWIRDLGILTSEYAELEKSGGDTSRVLFYLAQTFQCLGLLDEAYHYYELRSKRTTGFDEERFASRLRCGEIAMTKGQTELACQWLLESFRQLPRAEPLVYLAQIERHRRQFDLAYAFAKLACNLSYPVNALLPVDTKCYSYTRWHVLGIVAYYSMAPDRVSIGKHACEMAILAGCDVITDSSNAKFYL